MRTAERRPESRFPTARRVVLLTLLIGVVGTQTLLAYTPESPEVQTLIRRAVKFLEKEDSIDGALLALSAMAIYKSGEPESHPLVQKSLKECVNVCRSPEMVDNVLNSVYKAAVVGLFLAEVDADKYQKEVQNVIASLEKRQKPPGGWGYPTPPTHWEGGDTSGDTSMTQYAVLCLWQARASGAADVSPSAIKKVANWLVRTQDPSGAWGYQGRDPGEGTYSQRVPQTEVRHSLGVAALGSLYISSGIIGITPDAGTLVDDDLPSALKRIDQPTPSGTSAGEHSKQIKRAIRDGNRWYEQNYRINPEQYTLYYLYTLERYQSFREIAEGKYRKEPRWYNDGVRFLQSTQKKGSWDMEGGTNDVADTAFGILFLIRSTQKTIQKSLDEFGGTLVAGRGLPGNTENVQMKRGRLVTTPFQGTATSLLEILGNEDHPDFDSVASLEAVPISSDAKEAALQQARLRRLVSAESWKTRLVAVKSLSTMRNLDNVPALIYALSDPDLRVALAARDGLRFNSRKFGGFGFAEGKSDAPSDAERKRATDAWKKWYLEIRPNAVFLQD